MAGKHWIFAGALLAALSVAAGAFGAHVLEGRLGGKQLQNFELAARYQMYHALGLVLVGLIAARGPSSCVHAAGWLFLAGIVLFSGGLYAWSLTDARAAALIVPIGGTSWIIGWISLAWGAWRA